MWTVSKTGKVLELWKALTTLAAWWKVYFTFPNCGLRVKLHGRSEESVSVRYMGG